MSTRRSPSAAERSGQREADLETVRRSGERLPVEQHADVDVALGMQAARGGAAEEPGGHQAANRTRGERRGDRRLVEGRWRAVHG
jgi:hypothetical protein